MLKNLSKQSDYDKQLLNGKVIQKTLTSHKFFNKFIFSFFFYHIETTHI